MEFIPEPGNSIFDEEAVTPAPMLILERDEDDCVGIDDPSRSMSTDERLGLLIRALWTELTGRWDDEED